MHRAKASEIVAIFNDLEDRQVALEMANAFSWDDACEDYPDMSAEEIASMAADGFMVPA